MVWFPVWAKPISLVSGLAQTAPNQTKLNFSNTNEKVVRSYKTGSYVSSGDFSARLCNTWVRQYNKNFNKMTAKHWEEVLEYYSITPS
jgi:hypothetical protein